MESSLNFNSVLPGDPWLPQNIHDPSRNLTYAQTFEKEAGYRNRMYKCVIKSICKLRQLMIKRLEGMSK